jgi:hypothetical protein
LRVISIRFSFRTLLFIANDRTNGCRLCEPVKTPSSYVCIYNILKKTTKDFLNFSNRPKRKHDFQIILQHYSSIAKNSFFIRNSNVWNLLPKDIVNSQTPGEFKAKLYNSQQICLMRDLALTL